MVFLFSYMIGLLSLTVAAPTPGPASCTNIEHQIPLGPTTTQGGTSWCFAFAAATLASHKTGKAISPAAIVADYYAHPKAQNLWHHFKNKDKSIIDRGGYTDVALKISQEVGFCAYEDLPMSHKVSFERRHMDLDVDQILKMLEDVEKLQKSDTPQASSCASLQQSHAYAYRVLKANPKQFGLSDFYEVLKKTQEGSIAHWINKNCKKRFTLPQDQEVVTEKLSLYTLAGRISSSELPDRVNRVSAKLNKGPVALMVFSGSLAPPYPNGKADHAIVAIGQRWNAQAQRCELKIRDSSYDKDQWIPADMVVKTADEMITLEQRPSPTAQIGTTEEIPF